MNIIDSLYKEVQGKTNSRSEDVVNRVFSKIEASMDGLTSLDQYVDKKIKLTKLNRLCNNYEMFESYPNVPLEQFWRLCDRRDQLEFQLNELKISSRGIRSLRKDILQKI